MSTIKDESFSGMEPTACLKTEIRLNMTTFGSKSSLTRYVLVVLDKATFDALVADDSQVSEEMAEKICSEVDRVLKHGGRYICVTLAQKHVLNQLVQNMANKYDRNSLFIGMFDTVIASLTVVGGTRFALTSSTSTVRSNPMTWCSVSYSQR